MAVVKEHKEFYTVDLKRGWENLPGYPAGIQQQVLAGFLDEKSRRGFRTRHLRFEPGVYTTEPFVHEYWEEVYVVSGDLFVGSDRSGKGGTRFGPIPTRAVLRERRTGRSGPRAAACSSSCTTT